MTDMAALPPIGNAGGAPASFGTPSPPSRSDALRADFGAMVLRPFVEAMVPEGDAMFGEGTAGAAWRGFLVDALAREVALDGSLGLDALLPETVTGRGAGE